jgi:hypothetical protein
MAVGLAALLGWAPVGCGFEKLGRSPEEPFPPLLPGEISLFDGRSLEGWEITRFGGEGPVEVRGGSIVLHRGETLTGITWAGDFPQENYRLRLEAQRLDGNDFFCGLTFPVGDSHCTLILGGWGGAVVGLSSIDGRDASENETRQIMRFDNGRWYRIEVEVTAERVRCRLDGHLLADVARASRTFSVRPEVRLSRPLGIAAWRTTAAVRAIRMAPPENP